MRRTPPLMLLAVLTIGCGSGSAPAPDPQRPPDGTVTSITAADMEADIAALADDSTRGRDTPSAELDEVARWLAGELASAGVEPAFGTTYEQIYQVHTGRPDFARSWGLTETGDTLRFGEALSVPFGVGGPAEVRGGVTLVFGEAAGLADVLGPGSLEGRVAVLMEPASGQGGASGLLGQIRAVNAAGAAATLSVSDVSDEAWRASAAIASERLRTTRMGSSPPPPYLAIRQEALLGWLGAAAEPTEAGAAEVRPLEGRTLALILESEGVEVPAPNVAGIVRGSDPELASEYVLFSAHFDHVGVGRPDETGDSIYNGADDDASGTATVLEIARAAAAADPAPRRSMIFVFVSGEEKGLWGSAHYAEDPAVPLDDVVAGLNVDMVGRNWPDTIVVIGQEHSDLGERLDRVVAAHPDLGMTPIDDRWPDQNFYRRSDHFNFARRGVPILFFFNGVHEDYHRPSDELERIDTEKAARIARLIFLLGWDLANSPERPEWVPDSYRAIVQGG